MRGVKVVTTNQTWDGSASRWTDAKAYCNSSLINQNSSDNPDEWVKSACALPVYEPNGDININAVHAAASALAGGRGGVKAPPAVKKAAARKLVKIYGQMQEDVPDSIKNMAQ
jgi:hypothetical protein